MEVLARHARSVAARFSLKSKFLLAQGCVASGLSADTYEEHEEGQYRALLMTFVRPRSAYPPDAASLSRVVT